jgi:hypothetical protein
MSITLSQTAYDHAQRLVKEGRVVFDDHHAWTEHRPSKHQEDEFIARHGMEEYAKWHLGIDETKPERNKGRYRFPYGDFKKVHRCAVQLAESRAGQYKFLDIEHAVAHLHGMIEEAAAVAAPKRHKVAGRSS